MDAAYRQRVAAACARVGAPASYGQTSGLPLQSEAPALETVRVLSDGREIRLAPAAAAAWRGLAAAAQVDGVALILISGYRSVQRQVEIIQKRLAAGDAIEEVLRINAAPGYSEHHTGCAVDIGVMGCPPLSEAFERTAAFAWLQRNASIHGFRLSYPRGNPHGIVYEPWHWLWSDAAQASRDRTTSP